MPSLLPWQILNIYYWELLIPISHLHLPSCWVEWTHPLLTWTQTIWLPLGKLNESSTSFLINFRFAWRFRFWNDSKMEPFSASAWAPVVRLPHVGSGRLHAESRVYRCLSAQCRNQPGSIRWKQECTLKRRVSGRKTTLLMWNWNDDTIQCSSFL